MANAITDLLASVDTVNDPPPSRELVDWLHRNAGTDRFDLHHMIGHGATDVAAGDHDHDGRNSSSAFYPTATTDGAGIIRIATIAETLALTATDLAISPADLDAARKDRPIQGQIPTSVVVGSGSATVADDGTVFLSGVSWFALNDIFDGVGMDVYDIVVRVDGLTGAGYPLIRLAAAGSAITANAYNSQSIWAGGSTTPSANRWVGSNSFVIEGTNSTIDNLRIQLRGPGRAARTTGFADRISSGAGSIGIATSTWDMTNTVAYDGLHLIYNGAGQMTGHVKVVKIA